MKTLIKIPITTIFKVETTAKEDPKRLTTNDFPPTFSQFKEGSLKINETKAPQWIDVKIKTKQVGIYNDERPKTTNIGNYQNEEQTIEIIKLLK